MIAYFQRIVNYIIRPTRDNYHPNRLGPKQAEIRSVLTGNLNSIHRIDQVISSHQAHNRIQLSFYQNQSANPHNCVIYLHANNGSRVQGLPYLKSLLENDLNVCFFDFLGSGLSDGQYITLGINQSKCLECVFKHLLQTKGIENCVLWGRSMGAVTALIYANRCPKGVVGMILDSPFKDMRKLIKQLAADRTGFPKFLFDPVITYLDLDVKQKTGISILDLKVKNHMQNNAFKHIPALFLVSKNDKLVKSHHGEKIFSRYLSDDKILKYIDIQHHENRQANIIGACKNFILRVFDQSNNLNHMSNQKLRIKDSKLKRHLKSKRTQNIKIENQPRTMIPIYCLDWQNNNKNHQIHRPFVRNGGFNYHYLQSQNQIINKPIISNQNSHLLRQYYLGYPNAQPINSPKMLPFSSLPIHNKASFERQGQQFSQGDSTGRRRETKEKIINSQMVNYFQDKMQHRKILLNHSDERTILNSKSQQRKRNSKQNKISLSNNIRIQSVSSPHQAYRTMNK